MHVVYVYLYVYSTFRQCSGSQLVVLSSGSQPGVWDHYECNESISEGPQITLEADFLCSFNGKHTLLGPRNTKSCPVKAENQSFKGTHYKSTTPET